MMRDPFGREINYLRISVTDRCNLQCSYCVPKTGLPTLPANQLMTVEEIISIVKVAVQLGINKVRLTGGEPLLREDIVDIVKQLSAIQEITDLAMTTNGTFLTKYAKVLAQAGLMRVNVGLYTTCPARFQQITQHHQLDDALQGIDSALQAGLTPLKINCVYLNSQSDENVQLVKAYAAKKGLEVRLISLMNFQQGRFSKIQGGMGGDCPRCNRLRLLCDGRILPCLFSERTFSTRELGIVHAFQQALAHKPERGQPCHWKGLRSIGG